MTEKKSLPIVGAVYDHNKGQLFKNLPSITQIEVTNRCNLQCPMCYRTTDMMRSPRNLDLGLLRTMIARGDFAGSSYVELQMAGEPTLHPELGTIVDLLHRDAGVLVGLSTHGLCMVKEGVTEALLKLDALTISIDSTNPDTYAKLRYPGTLEKLYANLDYFFKQFSQAQNTPFTELQLVKTDLAKGTGNIAALQKVAERRGWAPYVTIRTTADCFSEMQGRVAEGTNPRNTDLCITPYTAVSITADGSVVSCCFIFEPNRSQVNYYGDLNQQSLAEIWSSDRVKEMQRQQKCGELSGQCTKCYLKSPTFIQANIVSRLTQRRMKQSGGWLCGACGSCPSSPSGSVIPSNGFGGFQKGFGTASTFVL